MYSYGLSGCYKVREKLFFIFGLSGNSPVIQDRDPGVLFVRSSVRLLVVSWEIDLYRCFISMTLCFSSLHLRCLEKVYLHDRLWFMNERKRNKKNIKNS